MLIKKLTDPLTGLEFTALSDKDGNLTVQTAFDGVVTFNYNEVDGTYKVPAYIFTYRQNLSLNECARLLDVSKVRVSRLCANGTLKSVKVGNALVIDKKSALEYRSTLDGTHATD